MAWVLLQPELILHAQNNGSNKDLQALMEAVAEGTLSTTQQ